MNICMRYIVRKVRPISTVEDKDTRDLCKTEERFGPKSFKEALFKVVELVERSIVVGTLKTRGATMNEGWPNDSTH